MNRNESSWASQQPARRGVVGVVARHSHLLVIRRSRHVAAPGAFCFPGGGIEAGESEPEALCREFLEELNAQITPVSRLWTSRTPWNVNLSWWEAHLADEQLGCLRPNPQEVASVHWVPRSQLPWLPGLLSSNHAFLDSCDALLRAREQGQSDRFPSAGGK